MVITYFSIFPLHYSICCSRYSFPLRTDQYGFIYCNFILAVILTEKCQQTQTQPFWFLKHLRRMLDFHVSGFVYYSNEKKNLPFKKCDKEVTKNVTRRDSSKTDLVDRNTMMDVWAGIIIQRIVSSSNKNQGSQTLVTKP